MPNKTLSTDQQNRAINTILRQARPIDRALYAYIFEDGTQEAVLDQLATFQNADGGFGHGLEGDLRLADSSVIATTIALQLTRELHVPAEHPLIERACGYLMATYDSARQLWPIIPDNTGDAPHAPWWSDAASWLTMPDNPRAEIAGYMHDYVIHFPAALRDELTEVVIAHVHDLPDEIEMHELLCFLRFYETPSLPEAVRQRMRDKMERALKAVVVTDPAQWAGYGLQPLSVAPSPQSAFAAMLAEAVQANLDFLIGQQTADGDWVPAWTWGDAYPEAWEKAKVEISGQLTVRNLIILRGYHRLE